ncbi:hypothetical protein QJS10_CPA01g02290 [Acorus calamus]|uniref:Uncharacterized protein n=1 Tax=Acorus calamus TaxID=4465 RepID=A0AAV9FHI8_ACOCL|nr:hypothetical protein QJS10_CPA01g02290 [Acorus calamus]
MDGRSQTGGILSGFLLGPLSKKLGTSSVKKDSSLSGLNGYGRNINPLSSRLVLGLLCRNGLTNNSRWEPKNHNADNLCGGYLDDMEGKMSASV